MNAVDLVAVSASHRHVSATWDLIGGIRELCEVLGRLTVAASLCVSATVGPVNAGGWILGIGANLNEVKLDHVMRGFGDRLVWEFASESGERHIVSSIDIVRGGNTVDTAPEPLRRSLNDLRNNQGLDRAGFMTLWVTRSWDESWYPVRDLQEALDRGMTPVFLDWYFGDGLLDGDRRDIAPEALGAYANHSRRFGRFLGQFDGDILVVMEPELNKPWVEAWPEFGNIIRKHGIAEIRAGIEEMNAKTGKETFAFFGVTLNDNGLRDPTIADGVYGTKAKGDSYGWQLSRDLLEVLRPDLDFVGFQEILAQFHRDHEFPDLPQSNTADEIGLDDLPDRIVNYCKWLKQQLGIPILLPYIGLATSTWSDRNGNGRIDPHEINELGWQHEVGAVLEELQEREGDLFEAGVVGIGAMMLFDDPAHNLGGYQYLLANEYALGLISTDADNGVAGATFSTAISPKRYNGRSFVEIFFETP